MRFKSWLLNEDPDHFNIGSDYIDRFEDSTTFINLDGFTIYSSAPAVTHGQLIGRLSSCIGSIEGYLEGKAELKDVSWCVLQSLDKKGTLTHKSVEMMNSIMDGLTRKSMMEKAPDVISGRMWHKYKVISFWNPLSSIFKNKHHIVDFISKIKEKPNEFKYEIEGKMMTYEEFWSGQKTSPSLNFDPAKLHTMAPSSVKKALLGTSPYKGTDLATKMKSYAGD
jgi:hypothetical protein